MKRPGRFLMILCVINAVLGTINVILGVTEQSYHDSVVLFILRTLTTLAWIILSIVSIKKYFSKQDNDKD